MKSPAKLLVTSLFLLLLQACGATLSRQAVDSRIQVVTHPQMVSGMEFVSGYTTGKTTWDMQSVGNQAANDAAKQGMTDARILVETNSVGIDLYTYRVSIYRKR
jgi:hypothetical protein